MLYYLSFGLVMGMTAGLSPGPLLTLVITETLQHGIKAGVKIALAPILSDAPIVIVMLLFVGQLSDINAIVGTLSLVGGCYVLYIAYHSAGTKGPASQNSTRTSSSISKGVLANLLSPHPYVFWLTVGAPVVVKSVDISNIAPLVFIIGFYFPLVGSKVLLANLVGKYSSLLSGESYKNIMRCLALLLGMFGFILLFDGLELLGVYGGF